MNTEVGHCCLFLILFLVALSGNFVLVLATSRCLFEEMCMRASVCARAGQREIETREEWAAIYSKRRVGGRGVRVCAIEQPPVMRGSMLTRMVSNTAWGNSSFTPRLKPSSLFCLPSSVNISLSPGTDSGVNRNQIMHTNTSVTQDFQQSFCLSLPHSFSHTVLFHLSVSLY